MGHISDYKLFLFFTRDNGLFTWQSTGTLDRETRTYREFLPNLAGIDFVTYGNRNDLELAPKLGGIGLRCNKYGLHPRIYTPLLAHWLPRIWPRPAIFKSNQVKGAEIMLAAAHATGALSITRAGYLPSNIEAWAHGADSTQARTMRALEERVFRGADRVVVTTQVMADTVVGRYRLDGSKLKVIPNYVDTDLFKPAQTKTNLQRLVYVGRLHREKNLDSLLSALKGLDVELVLIGDGELKSHLKERAQKEKLNVKFLGTRPNSELPDHINGAAAFVFPSLGEHHPKSLIEAMSCGASVIACRVPGVRDIIDHGRTGWLCGTAPEELRDAIKKITGDATLRERIGRKARQYCLEHYALERVARLELDLYRELVE